MTVLFVVCLWCVVLIVAKGQFKTFQQEYEARRLKKLAYKKTEYMARAWIRIAKRYDPVTEPDKRGLAVARALNLWHSLEVMKENDY